MELSEFKYLNIEIKDRIAVVTIDNPPLNLLNAALMAELRELFIILPQNTDLRVLILTANGKHFCPGADVVDFKNMPRGGISPYGHYLMNLIESCPLATIAAINGNCFGGGLEMSLAFDFRLASETAKLGLVEANIGISANYGGNSRLPLLIGEQRAKYMFFTSEHISAEKAKEFGLVLEVYKPEELMDKTLEFAAKIADNAPKSIAVFKQIITDMRKPLLGGSLINECFSSYTLSVTEDAKEGWRAFKEKRPPVFKNK